MDINRNNYEEYFLLYIDRELNDTERDAVEEFLGDNPDLQQEMLMLQDMTLTPEHIQFPGKESILHHTLQHNMVNIGNREEMFILYADNELAIEECAAVEQFIAQNEHYRHELEAIQHVRLKPDGSVVFSNKQVLFHGQATARPMIIRWLSVSAAACLLLIAGALWRNKQPIQTKPPFAQSRATAPKRANDRNKADHKPDLTATDKRRRSAQPVENLPAPDSNVAVASPGRTVINKKRITLQPARPRQQTQRQEALTIAKAAVKKDIRNAQATANPVDVKEPLAITPEETVVISPEKSTSPVTMTSKALVIDEMVTVNQFPAERNNTPVILTNIAVDNKNPLRGLFRKAARVVERNASLRALKTPGIHIGNIEIALN